MLSYKAWGSDGGAGKVPANLFIFIFYFLCEKHVPPRTTG